MRARRLVSVITVSTLLALSAVPLFAAPAGARNVANASDFRDAWEDSAETLITLTADITLECEEVEPTPPRRVSQVAIVVDGAGFTLHNPCALHALEAEDPLEFDAGLVTLRNLRLTGNALSEDALNTEGPAVVELGSVVRDHGGDGIDADGNVTVSASTIIANGERGVESGEDAVVTGPSTISDNGESGIDADDDVTVTGATISGNGDGGGNCDNGIRAGGDASVTSSTVSGNDDVGILSDTGTITVVGSTVSGNGEIGECDEDGIRADSEAGASVTVTNTTVSNNVGAGIWTDGAVTLDGSTVTGNGEVDAGNDGVDADGDVTVMRSTVSGNFGDGVGGEDVVITDSTVSSNAESGVDAATATLTNSTIHGNTLIGIDAFTTVTATHATITGNGININNVEPTTIHLFGSVLLDAGTVNCVGAVDDQGFNFVDDASCVGITPSLADPQLGGLQGNGGPTQTRLPADTSPLVDGIPSASCEITTEQRGLVTRPSGAGCDIGSLEVLVVPPTVSIADAASVVEGNPPSTATGSFTVTLSKASSSTVTVAFATANGTASAPGDYQSKSGTVSFAPGDVSEMVTVTVVGDSTDEPNETFVVNLSAPSGATIADGQGSATILDDDGAPALSINDVTVAEGNSGTVDGIFTVRLLPASANTVTVAFASANGTATAPADYQSAAGTLTFTPGDTEETITVRVVGDTLDEPNETFAVNLSTANGATISDAQGTGTINDDDAPLLSDTATARGEPVGGLAGLAAILTAGVTATVIRRQRGAHARRD